MSNYKVNWTWTCSDSKFDEFRNDPSFVALVRLARITNGLRFCQGAVYASRKDFNPEGRRQRSNGFLMTCGLLFEGFKILDDAESHLKQYTTFNNFFVPLISHKRVKELLGSDLRKTRNKIVFHYDRSVVTASLSSIKRPEYRFVAGLDDTAGSTFYELADEIVVNYLIDGGDTSLNYSARLQRFVSDVTYVSTEFLSAADKLIVEALEKMGWTEVERPNS